MLTTATPITSAAEPANQICVLLLAPTRSSAELKQLLGEDFEGILSSDCFSAYNPHSAAACTEVFNSSRTGLGGAQAQPV